MQDPSYERFKEDLDKLKLRFPVADLAKATGFPKSNISEYINAKKLPSKNFLKKFYDVYYPESGYFIENVLQENDAAETYIEQRRKQKLTSSVYMVPLVPVKAQAGYVKSYLDSDYINNLEMYPIVPGIEPRGSTWRYFEVEGESMRDTLAPRDLVLCSFVPDFDWMETKDKYVHVIVTAERVIIKRLRKATTNYWILKSDNKDEDENGKRLYPDMRIEIKDILEVWRGRRKIGADLGPTRITKHYELD